MSTTTFLVRVPSEAADASSTPESSVNALRESEQRYRLLFEHNPHPMWMHDEETLRFVAVNDAAVRNYGYSREEFLSMTVADIRPAEEASGIEPSPHQPGPVLHMRKDGSVQWVDVTAHPVWTQSEKLTFVLAQDATKRKGLEDELRRKAAQGSKTPALLQSLIEQFEQAKELARRRNQRLAILAVDFDGLEHINETFGESVADEFLKASLKRMKLALRASDTVERTGGDEFAIIAGPVASPAECRGIAERMLSVQRAAMKMDELELPTSISVGLSIYPEDGDSLTDLLRRACYGLNQAKEAGRDCCRRYSAQEIAGTLDATPINR